MRGWGAGHERVVESGAVAGDFDHRPVDGGGGVAGRMALTEIEERYEMMLAAITAAALGNTLASVVDRLPRDNPYWTATYGDVCAAVDREMAYRTELTGIRAELAAIVRRVDGL